jgi:hypothetical protein
VSDLFEVVECGDQPADRTTQLDKISCANNVVSALKIESSVIRERVATMTEKG